MLLNEILHHNFRDLNFVPHFLQGEGALTLDGEQLFLLVKAAVELSSFARVTVIILPLLVMAFSHTMEQFL